jgi:hypothetical protein
MAAHTSKCAQGLQYYRNTTKKDGLKMMKLAIVVYISLICWENKKTASECTIPLNLTYGDTLFHIAIQR